MFQKSGFKRGLDCHDFGLLIVSSTVLYVLFVCFCMLLFFFFFFWCLRKSGFKRGLVVKGMEGGGGRGRLYTCRYTVTSRMIPALRWAAMRAIL